MRYVPSLLFFGCLCFLIILADLDRKHPIIKMIEELPLGDKAGHFIVFGLLACLVNVALRFRRVQILHWDVNFSGLLVLSFAVVEEFTQIAFASRIFDFNDMLCNALGVWFFVFVSEWFGKRVWKSQG